MLSFPSVLQGTKCSSLFIAMVLAKQCYIDRYTYHSAGKFSDLATDIEVDASNGQPSLFLLPGTSFQPISTISLFTVFHQPWYSQQQRSIIIRKAQQQLVPAATTSLPAVPTTWQYTGLLGWVFGQNVNNQNTNGQNTKWFVGILS